MCSKIWRSLEGGQFDPPPEISAGKVRNGPRMAQMDGKQVILTNRGSNWPPPSRMGANSELWKFTIFAKNVNFRNYFRQKRPNGGFFGVHELNKISKLGHFTTYKMIFGLKHTKIQIFTSRRRFSDFQNRKKSNFGLGPKIKPGLRIFPLEIEFFSKNIIFFSDIKFSSLKIARDSDKNCRFHLRKCAKIFFFEK